MQQRGAIELPDMLELYEVPQEDYLGVFQMIIKCARYIACVNGHAIGME